MLLYKDGNFMQALEGEGKVVRGLFKKIAKDPRHHDLEVLIEEELQQRQFADYSMAFRNLGSPEALKTPGYSHFLREPLNSKRFFKDPTTAQRLLLMFKETM